MINIGITTYNRENRVLKCIDSVLKNTVVPYTLFVYDDASTDRTGDLIRKRYKGRDEITLITGVKRKGIVPGFNTLWKFSQSFNDFKYFCYLQDDTEITERGWLDTLINCYEEASGLGEYPVGLFSGHHAPEHPTVGGMSILGRHVIFKKSIRSTNMIAPYEFWHKIGYVPLNNPDGTPRGFPGPPNPDGSRGKGSNIDLYITGFQSKGIFVKGAAGPTCSWRLGTYCMVVPGLVKHTAVSKEDSTWGNPNKEFGE